MIYKNQKNAFFGFALALTLTSTAVQARSEFAYENQTSAENLNAAEADEEENLSLEQVRMMVHGPDHLHPSRDSLIGKYLAETKADTLIQSFWTATENSIVPPRERGPERLVVAVSEDTFPVFQKYFMSKHFLYLLNEHGNFAAFEGKMSNPHDPWHAQVMDVPFEYLDRDNLGQSARTEKHPRIAAPMLLDSQEGLRARAYFKLASLSRDLARFPWYLKSADGKNYSGRGAWSTGCGTWIGNMPIGNKTVNEYYFPSGDQGENPVHPPLQKYEIPPYTDAETAGLLREVWQVPGHQQLGEILNPGANRRGELDNAGWATYTFVGSAPAERVPVIFYFVKNARKNIKEDFTFAVDALGAY